MGTLLGMPLVTTESLRSWVVDASPRQWARRAAVGAGCVVALAVLFLVYTYVTVSLPANADQVRSTTIRDATGGTLADLVGGHERVDVPLDKVAPALQQAVVATEDRHFYGHGGVDPIGMARAFTHDLRGG